jgi:hypothetical protein
MLDRDLRMQALMLATQLPDDEMTARRVYTMLGELIDHWIYKDGIIHSSTLPSNPAGASLNADSKCIGNDERFPV